MTSSAITPGSTATVSTNVTVSVDNAESYSLSLKVDNTNLTNGSTTIIPGNVTNDNTWGYKWDNASTYTAPNTTGTNLTVPTLTNNSVSFTKNLTFGAKFAGSAEAGHYKGSGILSLVATPKTTAKWSNGIDSGVEYMQDITPGTSASSFCKSSLPNHASITLKDKRDDKSYTIVKMADGKCWMTQNLQLMGSRTLTSADSNVTSNYTLPASSTSGFSSDTASNAYLSGSTGYYTWCAATAGTCSSATSGGQQAPSSICPKGWKLPSGNSGGEFEAFANAEGIANSSAGSTKIRGTPYNFAYTGRMSNGSMGSTSGGYWWSRTASNSSNAYVLYIDGSSVNPGTNNYTRYGGFAVRCVAEEHITYTLSYDINRSGASAERIEYFATKYPTQTSSNKTFTIPNESIAMDFGGSCTYKLLGFSDVTSGSVKYNLGQEITLDDTSFELKLYALWALNGCS